MSQGIKFDAIKSLGVQYGFSVQEDLSVVWHKARPKTNRCRNRSKISRDDWYSFHSTVH